MEKPTILVVEDDPLIRDCLVDLLGDEGYRVISAEHGARALKILDLEMPDLILTDIGMPIMDGRELIRRLRRCRDLRQIPTVVFSAEPGLGGDECLDAIEVVEKSRSRETLLEVVRGKLSAAARPSVAW